MTQTLTIKFLLFQVLIVVPLILGATVRRRALLGPKATKRLINLNLMLIEPVIVLWSIWGLELTGSMLLLPVTGALLVLIGGLGGWLALRLRPLPRTSHASFLISSALANHGFTLGGFVCYVLLGEAGLGRAFIFIAYFMLVLMSVIFPYARVMGRQPGSQAGWLRNYVLTPQNLPLAAVLTAIALQLAGIGRPDWNPPIDALLVISISLYYFTVGFNFDFSRQGLYLPENALLAVIKFGLVPLAAWGLVQLLPLDVLSLKVILIEACMPAATYSVVSSVLFDLDARLASGLFIVNTLLFLLIILPLMVLVLPL
ncbi:MAG: Membrane transport protein [Deltaproteobacteria bacterium ADurb.Bin510]|nr:MAG: Membrane transport protein [Deltaproteobacteria bacterium ADurb.Bin510]